MIIKKLEVEIVTLRKVLQKKNMQNNSKVLNDVINSQRPNHENPRLGYNHIERDQYPKQENKKHIQKVMQKQSKG